MFARSPRAEEPSYDDIVTAILTDMKAYGPREPEYLALLDKLERVEALRKPKGKKREISWDNLILVAGNLLGIVIIVAYEQKHVMNSKGLGFILKPR